MSPYVRTYTTPSGATGVQVITKHHGKRSFKHIGSAHNDAELAILLTRAEQVAAGGQRALDLDELTGTVRPAKSGAALMTSTRSALLVKVLTHAWHALGLDEAVGGDEGFMQMVMARLVEPTSKEQVPQVLGELGITGVTVRTLFRSLARCVELDWRTSIQAALHQHVTTHGDLSLVLYDCTTLYFETDKEDALRKVGYSKERRVDPQVTWSAGYFSDCGCFACHAAISQPSSSRSTSLGVR